MTETHAKRKRLESFARYKRREFAGDISIGRGFKPLPSASSKNLVHHINRMLSIVFSEFRREFRASPRYSNQTFLQVLQEIVEDAEQEPIATSMET
jgi:hypothetical protein